MYSSLTSVMRRHGIPATTSHLLDLVGGISEGFGNTMGDFYLLAKATYVKRPSEKAGFERAFFEYFLGVDSDGYDTLESAILNSTRYLMWRQRSGSDGSPQDFVQTMFNTGLATQEQAREHTKKMQKTGAQPHKDKSFQGASDPESTLRQWSHDPGGYTVNDDHVAAENNFQDVDHQKLEDTLANLLKVQKEKHEGGNSWIGQKGNGAFGNNGFSKYGIRVGGEGKTGTARRVMNDQTRQTGHTFEGNVKGYEGGSMQQALEGLKLMHADGARCEFNLRRTIRAIGNKGYIVPQYDRTEVDKMRVKLFIDNGGRSMNMHVPVVEKLFAKMKSQLRSLDVYYFHNCIYDEVFTDANRTRPISLGAITNSDPATRVIVVGDAAMNPYYEVNQGTLTQLRDAFTHSAWVNPLDIRDWNRVQSVDMIRDIYAMFELTPKGLYQAVEHLTRE